MSPPAALRDALGTLCRLAASHGQNNAARHNTPRAAKERPILTVGRCTIAKTETLSFVVRYYRNFILLRFSPLGNVF